MKWQLYEQLSRHGTRLPKPKAILVTLDQGHKLLAFNETTLVAEITPQVISFHRDGILIKGICRSGERYYYQEWWLTLEVLK